MNPLQNTEPKEVFKWFYEISQVPRGSGNERAISDFLVKFAKDRNLEVHQDKAMNVIIKKPELPAMKNLRQLLFRDTWIWFVKRMLPQIMIF